MRTYKPGDKLGWFVLVVRVVPGKRAKKTPGTGYIWKAKCRCGRVEKRNVKHLYRNVLQGHEPRCDRCRKDVKKAINEDVLANRAMVDALREMLGLAPLYSADTRDVDHMYADEQPVPWSAAPLMHAGA